MMFMKSSGHESMCLLVYTPNLTSLTMLEFYTKKAPRVCTSYMVPILQEAMLACGVRLHDFCTEREQGIYQVFFGCVCLSLFIYFGSRVPCFFRVLWLSKNCTYSEIGFHQNIQNITHTHQQKHVT